MIQDPPSNMRQIITSIILIAICSCKPSISGDDIEVVFSPGLVEFNHINMEVINSIKQPYKVHKITSSDYSFLYDILSFPKIETTSKAIPPYIFLKFDSITYVIGNNRVIESPPQVFSMSESEAYRIKCIIHFYDFIENAELQGMKEIQQFGMPDNYKYCPSNPNLPPEPFVKIVLQKQ